MRQGLALRYLSSKQWAISPDILATMGGIAARDLDNLDLSALGQIAPDAVAAYSGKKNQQGIEMRGDVAVIHVSGVISRYSNLFHAICGGTSTEALAKQITSAVNDPLCKGIALYCDSPGGEASGINELAEMIYTARGKKPIIAYVGGNGASACYWIAAAADKVVIDACAFVGSIGTVQSFRFRKSEEDVETLELVSSQSPHKRLDPRSEEGQEKYQKALDAMSDVFINSVAKYRGVSRQHVLDNFGQGWCLMGAEAVKAKMANSLGSFEGVINELTKGRINVSKENKFAAMSFSEGMATDDVIAALAEHRPDVIGAMTGSVAVGIPEASELNTSELVAMLEEHRPDAVEALKASGVETQVMAIDKAADVVKAAAAAGVPELAASLLGEGVTMEQATAKIAFAGGLRDVLAAAGMSGSMSALLEHEGDPVKMIGTAIHEAKAKASDEDELEPEVTKPKASGLSAEDIYAERNA
ncbi:MAG: S49 family peptidase [Aeromonadaceae bacterium]